MPDLRTRLVPLLLLLAAATPALAGTEEGDLAALKERLDRDRGHPVVLNFWATWCIPCIKEIPIFNDMQERLGGEGLRLLAVSLDPFVYPDPDEARQRVARLVADKSFALPGFLYFGEQDALFEEFDLPPGLPHTLLLGPDGEVLDRIEGQLEPAEVDALVERIRELLPREVPPPPRD